MSERDALPCEVCGKDIGDECCDLNNSGLYACEDCLEEEAKPTLTLIIGGLDDV